MYPTSHYTVDYSRLKDLLLPTFMRKPKTRAYLLGLVRPLDTLYTLFMRFRRDTLYKLQHTGQVVLLQKVLNDRFDNEQRRIYIDDGIVNDPTYVYTNAEDKPVYLGTQYIYTREELAYKDVDFTVVLPVGMTLSDEERIRMQSLINYYKLAAKTYRIINAT